jgi:hypothetical protein
MPSAEENRPIRRVERFLERLFAPAEGDPPHAAEGPDAPQAFPGPGGEARARPGPARALLTVDDAGDYLLCAGREVVLGHARGGGADLPVLADVGPRHARFVLCASLAGGEEWRLQPLGTERVFRNAEPVSTETVLADGDALRLGKNLEVDLALPDPASASAVLTFRRGVDCLGAAHVILVAPGPGGRIRLGAAARRHVRVPNLLTGAELVLEGERLVVVSEAGVSRGPGVRAGSLQLAFPPRDRVDVLVGPRPADGRPPFSFSLAPAPGAGEGQGS